MNENVTLRLAYCSIQYIPATVIRFNDRKYFLISKSSVVRTHINKQTRYRQESKREQEALNEDVQVRSDFEQRIVNRRHERCCICYFEIPLLRNSSLTMNILFPFLF